MKELLKTLALECAPSGREKAVAKLIEKEITPYCDSVTYDKIGNLIAVIKPRKKCERVMVCAHMDEVGFMVKNINNEGRINIVLLGAVETRTLSGRRVRFLDGTVGVVSTKPIHVMSNNEEERPTYEDRIYIEIGAKNRAEAENMVKIGDFGTFEPKFTPLAGETYAGKAIGGRACVSALISLIKETHAAKKAKNLQKECYFVFSVKREIARKLFAVETAAFNIRPQTALVLDAMPVCDYYPRDEREQEIGAVCGEGIVLSPADAKTLYDRTLFASAVSLCEKEGIAYQYPRTASGEGNESGSIHKSTDGVRTLSVGLPARNLHSGAEIIKYRDLEAVSTFVKAWLLSNED
ncbi:MAG: M42 family metallopeptidase [Ruminococcaceae bacterium]|nr:M42 family metallopeptidase [Oscillospiraceae bacterium]